MRIGVGIDTGGTYTDAVIYAFNEKRILYSSKALTTKENLSIGIGNALDGLPSEMLQKAEIISLSTTLATNACVEGKGGRAKLIFIGGYKKVVDETGQSYGLPPSEEIYFLEGGVNLKGEVVKEPEWDAFIKNCKDWIKDADAVAVVEHLGIHNPAFERKVKELVKETYDVNTICGHELFADYNYIKRGASTLLNARLIPVIGDFLKAIKVSLEKRNIKAPVVIVRSDGSLMSEKFTSVRPVETLLCGPAASVMGGIKLTDEKNCLIIDMGGTTTDIAIVRDGVPLKAKDGVNVGKWRTYVKAVYIDTFGLGGDSAVRVDGRGNMIMGPSRVIPLSIAADRWPSITEKLRELAAENRPKMEIEEFFCLVKDILNSSNYKEEEIALCEALRKGPRVLTDAARDAGIDIYTLSTQRLEKEGIIMRCGLTPTDIMHIRGDFKKYNIEAAALGTEYAAECMGVTAQVLSEMIYDRVKETLYINIVRMLLEDEYPEYRKNGLGTGLEKLIAESWKMLKRGAGESFLNLSFCTPAALVGLGAPIHIFLPDVAKALGTKYVVPENAGVANALGAVVGNISATCEIEIKPQNSAYGITGYIVFGKSCNSYVDSREEAIDIAVSEAKEAAKEEAVRRGASGDITVTAGVNVNTADWNGKGDIFLGVKVIATAVGRITL